MITDAESGYRAEVNARQALIDQAHAKLRETTGLLGEERRHLEELERKNTERQALIQQIGCLRRANVDQKSQLAKVGAMVRKDVSVGDADSGLKIDPTLLPSPPAQGQPAQVTQEQQKYLSELPRAELLQARVTAYRANNSGLQDRVLQLKCRSTRLEKKLRKVVALSVRVPEDKVEELSKNLTVAVESDKREDVDVGRLTDFLRKAQAVEGVAA
jgi:regulatory protein SWI6